MFSSSPNGIPIITMIKNFSRMKRFSSHLRPVVRASPVMPRETSISIRVCWNQLAGSVSVPSYAQLV